MKISPIESLALDPSIEIERFAGFDHATQRFIAHVLARVPDLAARMGDTATIAGNAPAPFTCSIIEALERDAAYVALPRLRACTAKGAEGQRQRRLHFGDLLGMAKVDLRWKRLTGLPEFIFCYERLAGPAWRQMLLPCWKEAVYQRRKRGAVQLPLDRRLVDDRSVPRGLEDDAAPVYFPTLADADAFGSPLLAGL